ncbi:MAG: hypothetical protein WKF30_15625 [Pyrinomonadaceae bacterium]
MNINGTAGGCAAPLGVEPIDQTCATDAPALGRSERRFDTLLSGAEVPGGDGHSEATRAGTGDGAASAAAALRQISLGANLNCPEDAVAAVRDAAQHIIRSRLGEHLRGTGEGERLTGELARYISLDPILAAKLLDILERAKTE